MNYGNRSCQKSNQSVTNELWLTGRRIMNVIEFLQACGDNDLEAVRALLEKDAGLVNAVSADGRCSALIVAIRHDHQEVIGALLARPNFDVNLTVNLRESCV